MPERRTDLQQPSVWLYERERQVQMEHHPQYRRKGRVGESFDPLELISKSGALYLEVRSLTFCLLRGLQDSLWRHFELDRVFSGSCQATLGQESATGHDTSGRKKSIVFIFFCFAYCGACSCESRRSERSLAEVMGVLTSSETLSSDSLVSKA